MKLLSITYDSAIDSSVMRLLDDLNVKGYTKTFDAHGLGQSGLKVNTPVWPGTNHQILIGGDEAFLREVAENVRSLQGEFKLLPGIYMLMLDAVEL